MTTEYHAKKPKVVKFIDEIKLLLGVCLQKDWSPEQITSRLHDEEFISPHHETVCQFILIDKAVADNFVNTCAIRAKHTENVMD